MRDRVGPAGARTAHVTAAELEGSQTIERDRKTRQTACAFFPLHRCRFPKTAHDTGLQLPRICDCNRELSLEKV
jgi:hypothetical protein